MSSLLNNVLIYKVIYIKENKYFTKKDINIKKCIIDTYIRRMMIVSAKLMGGLGNQLFQIFTTLAYGMRTDRKICFPYSYMLGSRHTYWDSFLKGLVPFTTMNGSSITNENLFSFPVFQEPGFEYYEIPPFQEEAVLLYGYFQSPRYFQKAYASICKLIGLEQQQEMVRQEYNKMIKEWIKVNLVF